MVVVNKDMKDQNFLCYYFRHIIFVNTIDFDEDQITFYDKSMQKTMKFQKVHIPLLASMLSWKM